MTDDRTDEPDGMPPDGVPSEAAVERERERWDAGKTVKERVYETALGLREPTTVAEVADRTGCAEESARTHLAWFADMGLVERVGDGRPARYRRNEAYFEWKRADRLRRELSAGELVDRRDRLVERDRDYQERYGVPSPNEVSAFDRAESGDTDVVESVWTDVNDWLTVREELRVVEQAQRLQRDHPSATA